MPSKTGLHKASVLNWRLERWSPSFLLQSHEPVLQQWSSPTPAKIPWVFLPSEVRSALNNSYTCAHPWFARSTIPLACHPSCGHFTFHGCSYHEWSILQRALRLSLEWRLNKDWLVPSMVPRKACRCQNCSWATIGNVGNAYEGILGSWLGS